MVFSDAFWRDYPDTGRSTEAYIVFYQVGSIDHCTHVPGPVAQYIADSEYNAAWTTGMVPAHSNMQNSEFLNKDSDVVPEQAPLIKLNRKSDIFMDNNGKDTKRTRHIYIRLRFVGNGDKFNFPNTVWCEGGLKLEDIVTNNVGWDKIILD